MKEVSKKWQLDYDNSFLPEVWSKLNGDPARKLIVLIIEHMKMTKSFTSISDLLQSCIVLNMSCTDEMKSVLGSKCNTVALKEFLSKFPCLFNVTNDNVSLIDRCLKWSFILNEEVILKPFRGCITDVEAIQYFRNRMLKEVKGNDPWLSFKVFQSFFKLASTDISLCVGRIQECWLFWLLKHSFIFRVKIKEKKVALRESLKSTKDETAKPDSVSLTVNDFELFMLIRQLLHMVKKIHVIELHSLYQQLPKFHKWFPCPSAVDFPLTIWRKSSFFSIDEKKMVSLNETVMPVIFIVGISFPYEGTQRDYIGHGKIKCINGPQATLESTYKKNTTVLCVDQALFGNHVKPLKSCFKVGDGFSFRAFLPKNRNVDSQQKEKWSITSVWTFHETFEQLQKKYEISN